VNYEPNQLTKTILRSCSTSLGISTCTTSYPRDSLQALIEGETCFLVGEPHLLFLGIELAIRIVFLEEPILFNLLLLLSLEMSSSETVGESPEDKCP